MPQIPVVTEVDLKDFHRKHFRPLFAPAHFFPSTNLTGVDGEDDDLGYYPDGVKRTLTDEQIAMFRHSEIQTLLRERRRLQSDSADLDGNSESPTVKISQSVPAKSPPKTLHSRKRKASANAEHDQCNPTSGYTHRRIAREQDEVIDAHVELDY